MNDRQLTKAGFKPFGPSRHFDRWDQGYQLRVRDKNGTQYFINVFRWDHAKYQTDLEAGWEIEVTYNDGCIFHPKAAVQIKAWSGVEKWTPKDVLAWAAELWGRLSPNYYERES